MGVRVRMRARVRVRVCGRECAGWSAHCVLLVLPWLGFGLVWVAGSRPDCTAGAHSTYQGDLFDRSHGAMPLFVTHVAPKRPDRYGAH